MRTVGAISRLIALTFDLIFHPPCFIPADVNKLHKSVICMFDIVSLYICVLIVCVQI